METNEEIRKTNEKYIDLTAEDDIREIIRHRITGGESVPVRMRMEIDPEPDQSTGSEPGVGKEISSEASQKTEALREAAGGQNVSAAEGAPLETTKKEEKRERTRKPIPKALLKRLAIAVCVLFMLSYVTGLIIFLRVFYPDTTLNGVVCGMKDPAETEVLLESAIADYELNVEGRAGVSGAITSAQIGLKPVFNGAVKKALREQHAYAWPFLFFRTHEISVEEVTLYSKESLRAAVKELPVFELKNIKKPVDAYVGDVTDTGYVVTKEDNGSVPIEGAIVTAVSEAVNTLERSVDIDNDTCYETAEITSKDPELNTLVNNLNQYCAAKIIYRFGEQTEVLDGQKISEWITVNGTEVSFDESAVSEYVKSLARKYDTFGQPHKLIKHDGEEITITQGAYGWWIDRPAETEELLAAIRSGYRGERTPVYKAEGATRGENDYGNNYVEIDLTEQHLWVYKEGKMVVESDFVSGNVSKGNGTHVGIYGITYKERDATLSGANYSSHVSYWMPFNGNEGMHDATWRSSFGGEIYLTGGSHGCVNLPKDKAAQIFDQVEEGEAVIIYGGKTYKPPVVEQPETPQIMTPEQQLQLLIDAGFLNPDGTIPETTTIQE
ncbi:MAG: L,D-transpeptidase/peptidoglycan binding protein [Lachnospiraceae bacterium]|nr:L,D-transpeptidase/peptidoglycan binding protein [Lachnospiraceae bacterium]